MREWRRGVMSVWRGSVWRAGIWVSIVAMACTTFVALRPSGVPAQPAPVCRQGAQPGAGAASGDDITDCTYERLGPARLRLTVMYSYSGSRGLTNVWLGADALAGGTRFKIFGFRPIPVARGSGRVTSTELFFTEKPPTATLTTDRVELFMYVGGGEIFVRRTFLLRFDWQL